MRLFGLRNNGPYMAHERTLDAYGSGLLSTAARYQIVPGTQGLPMVQLNLAFRRDQPTISNPDMTFAVVLDRSGSMSEAYGGGHVYNVAAAIFNHVAAAGVGYDLVFYDDKVSDAGHMDSLETIRAAIANNGPRGGTTVTGAIRAAIQKYHTRRGLYLIVITDGEFSDKTQVQNLVLKEMLPQITPENPYAFRLHFVGAGEGADHGFLKQIEADAAGQGAPLVSQHHHAHLSHSHASILDELDRAFLGVGTAVRFGDPIGVMDTTDSSGEAVEPVITQTTDVTTRRRWEGPVGTPEFLPRRVLLGCDYAPHHSENLGIAIQYQTPRHRSEHLTFSVPLPPEADTFPSSAPTLPPSRKPGFHLPWIHRTPEEEAAREDAIRQREAVARREAQVRQDEQRRQRHDLTALAQGGIPIQATERLKEIGDADAEGVLFTSNLSPEEAGLLRREGYQVRGLVSGSAMYHVGQAYASSVSDCEVTVLSDAYNTATELAVGRLQQELRLIGAHGVVGVRLSLVRHEWADKTIEVQVLGTAVEGPGRPPADPWMCDLSGQEWWALHRAGYEPASLAWGHCTWFILTTYQDQMLVQSWSNVELTHWSQALSQARHRALGYLTARARQHHATGIAGVKFERRLDEVHLTGPTGDPVYEREHHNLVVSIIGTGIRARPGAPVAVTPTVHVLSLRDGRLAPVALGATDATIE